MIQLPLPNLPLESSRIRNPAPGLQTNKRTSGLRRCPKPIRLGLITTNRQDLALLFVQEGDTRHLRAFQQVRIGKIKEALTNSTRPVKQIAYEMGYDNDDYFFTVFRRLTGMTPQQYRNLTRGPKENKK